MLVEVMPMPQNYAAKILLLFRDGGVSDWVSLVSALDKDKDIYDLMHFLPSTMENLLKASLLDAENASDYRDGTIRLSNNWSRIQNALGISLKELAKVDSDKSMLVQPLFEQPKKIPSDEAFDLFVLMPFKADLREVYEDHIKSVAASLSLKVARADDFFTTSAVMKDVWTAICRTRIIIADCTGRNPNVFYEIGLAHTVGKPVVLITQNSEDVPFDLRYIRYIPYEYTPRGMKKFEVNLTNTVKTVLRGLGRS